MQYGASLESFVATIDPLKQFRALKALSASEFLVTRAAKSRLKCRSQAALVAAMNLSHVHDLGSQAVEAFETRSVYFSKNEELPIVIDTGASLSLTPTLSDFIGDIKPCKLKELTGLSTKTSVVGVGTVEWTICDLFGVVRTLRTTAYYVPSATIRLFSPQSYFKEYRGGQCLVTEKRTVLTLFDGSELEFPFNPGSNLPLTLTQPKPAPMGLTFEDAVALGDAPSLHALLSVADETNQNLSAPQKELLLWHWKLGHPNFQWVQHLTRKPQDTAGVPAIIEPKHRTVSSCHAPLCAACSLAKQHRRTPPTRVSTPIRDCERLLRQGDLEPGARVSIDQYMSALPGRLGHTKGKEKKKDKYVGGTLFVDHATGLTFLRHQVSLRASDTVRAKQAFEQFAASHGVNVREYHADNVPFGSKAFEDHVALKTQTIHYSGTGARHQNGVAERAIQTVTYWPGHAR